MPKAQKKAGKALRHNPLAEQIIEEEGKVGIRTTPRMKQRNKNDEEEEADGVMPAALTQKVLEIAQQQKLTDDDLDGLLDEEGTVKDGDEPAEDVEIEDVEIDEEGYVLGVGTTEEEERALAMFLPGKGTQKAGQTLADVILQKIQEHDAKQQRNEAKEAASDAGGGLSPKVVQVYTEIGKWMKNFKSGKVPKAFKVIPNLVNWEEVLSLTSPLTWSPASMYEAVNIFASNFNPRMAQRFFNLVMLPAIRQDIAERKKLNFHYYRSLRKALFKPAAFFKGILLPLASENCTLREATILASVMSKASIPMMHAAATIIRLCVMTPWYGTTSILMAALVNKKYALPARVMDSLVLHFCAFVGEERALPLVWHRALLIFVQRYKFELSDEHKRRIKDLVKAQCHDAIASEVKRELLTPKPGEVASAAGGQSGAMEVG